MKQYNDITILGIETSCDDTCISVLKIKSKNAKGKTELKILSNIVSSQVEIHKKYGGVYPTMAKREHQKNLPLVLKQALKEAKISRPDLIAVTIGPGLDPCLWTGVNFAKYLAQRWSLKIIPVNHIEAHIFANLLPQVSLKSKIKNQKSKIQIKNKKIDQIKFPAVCLVVSGGHTQLILMKNIGKYKILGQTRDDAAGECFDKTARILGLGYPGGPIVAKMATKIKSQKSKVKNIKLPRPMIHSKDYDFSFSGLKTAVLYKVKNQKSIINNLKSKQAMCVQIQQAIIDVLIKKTIRAAQNHKAKTILLGGGVAANQELRKQFERKIKKEIPQMKYLMPEIQFCTDNAAMTAVTAYFHLKEAKSWKNIKVNANIEL